MTTKQEQQTDLLAERFEAEVREVDARLKVLQAQAEARQAKAEMDEISGLAAARERAKQSIANLKRKAAADRAAAKEEVEKSIVELQVGVQRVNERYSAWDSARERRLNARLDEADARLAAWKARADQQAVKDGMQFDVDLARLEEKIALARASRAQRNLEKYSAKADEALADAARNFDKAYDAAIRQYEVV
jgi:hypothetical protein